MYLEVRPFRGLTLGADFSLEACAPLRAYTGRLTVITGDSGTGKSSLLDMLAGFRSPFTPSGPVVVVIKLGPDTEVPLERFVGDAPARIAYLPQETNPRPSLKPRYLLEKWSRIIASAYPSQHHVRTTILRTQVELMQALFDPAEYEHLFGSRSRCLSNELSGGQKRRLDIILTLSSPAELILLDEPDTGLDQARRDKLFKALIQFAREHSKIILMVSHHAEREVTALDVDEWAIAVTSDGCLGQITARKAMTPATVPLELHAPPERGEDRRFIQGWHYLLQRLTPLLSDRRTLLWLIVVPVILMGLIRWVIQPTGEEEIRFILFFFAIACFWMGAIQAGGFWPREYIWFKRDCATGASSAAYLAGFLVYLVLISALQTALGAATLMVGQPIPEISWPYLFFWGWVAAINGIAVGLFILTGWMWWQRRASKKLPDVVTAQLLILCITLLTLVCSTPVLTIGGSNYKLLEDANQSDRWLICRREFSELKSFSNFRRSSAVFIAEGPWLANTAYQALWHQRANANRTDRGEVPTAGLTVSNFPGRIINLVFVTLWVVLTCLCGYLIKRRMT